MLKAPHKPTLVAVRDAEGRGVCSICEKTEQVSALHHVVVSLMLCARHARARSTVAPMAVPNQGSLSRDAAARSDSGLNKCKVARSDLMSEATARQRHVHMVYC